MKKLTILALALGLLAIAAASPAPAQSQPQRVVRLSGWVVDEHSGAKHANAESKEAVLAKATKGVALVLHTTKGETYPLFNQEEALEKVGQRWDVIGAINADGVLKVGTYFEPRPPKAPPQTEATEEKVDKAKEKEKDE
jgi:hypothetical protein